MKSTFSLLFVLCVFMAACNNETERDIEAIGDTLERRTDRMGDTIDATIDRWRDSLNRNDTSRNRP